MRKIYLLVFFIGFLSLVTKAQDSAHFNYTVGPNNLVSFTNLSILSTVSGNEPRKAHWFFGDGTQQATAPLANVSHQYVSGTSVYTVCLKIYKYWNNNNDSALTSSVCKVVTLQNTTTDSCMASFTDTIATGTHLFVAQPWHSTNKKPEQVCWNFGDGTTQTCINYNPALNNTYNTSHTYANPGTYNVCVKITYQGGCVANYCRIVKDSVAMDTCKADFTADPVPGSPHTKKLSAITWHAQGKKPQKICWQFNDGTPDTCLFYTNTYTGQYVVNHNFPPSYSTYNVCVKILYEGGCEVTKCRPVPVSPPDSCTVNLLESATNINNTIKHLYVTPNPGLIVQKICWYFGDGTDSCVQATATSPAPLSIAHQYPSPGTYNACVKVWYTNGCVVQKCKMVSIASQTTLCGGYLTDSLVGPKTYKFKGFNINNPNDYVISWKWNFGDGTPIANGQSVQHTYVNGGTYHVCLTILTNLGCETKICKPLQVSGTAQPMLTISPNPVTNTMNLVFVSTLQQPVTITIYNNNGVAVGNYVMNAIVGTNNWNINVMNLPPGIYSAVVHSAGQFASATFIKQ